MACSCVHPQQLLQPGPRPRGTCLLLIPCTCPNAGPAARRHRPWDAHAKASRSCSALHVASLIGSHSLSSKSGHLHQGTADTMI